MGISGDASNSLRTISPEIEELRRVLMPAWKKSTHYLELTQMLEAFHPSHGMCLATSLVVQDCSGGELLFVEFDKNSALFSNWTCHYWNLLADDREVDMTIQQFSPEERSGMPRGSSISREEALAFEEINTVNEWRYHDRRGPYIELAASVLDLLSN